MSIASVIERGGFVYVYDLNGVSITTIPSGNDKNDGLVGYTSGTVSIRRGNFIYTYDESGRALSSISI